MYSMASSSLYTLTSSGTEPYTLSVEELDELLEIELLDELLELEVLGLLEETELEELEFDELGLLDEPLEVEMFELVLLETSELLDVLLD